MIQQSVHRSGQCLNRYPDESLQKNIAILLRHGMGIQAKGHIDDQFRRHSSEMQKLDFYS